MNPNLPCLAWGTLRGKARVVQQCPELAAPRLHRCHASVLPSHLSSCLISLCSAPSRNFISSPDLIQATQDQTNVNVPQMVDTLMERVGNASWVVVFKALITTHHLMVHGHEVSVNTRLAPTLDVDSCAVVARGSVKAFILHWESNPAVVANGASAHLSFNIFGKKASEALPVAQSTFQMLAHLKWKLFFNVHSAMVGALRRRRGEYVRVPRNHVFMCNVKVVTNR